MSYNEQAMIEKYMTHEVEWRKHDSSGLFPTDDQFLTPITIKAIKKPKKERVFNVIGSEIEYNSKYIVFEHVTIDDKLDDYPVKDVKPSYNLRGELVAYVIYV